MLHLTASQFSIQEWTLDPFSLCINRHVRNSDPQGVFYATPFSGSLSTTMSHWDPYERKNDTSGGSSMQNGIRFSASPNIDV